MFCVALVGFLFHFDMFKKGIIQDILEIGCCAFICFCLLVFSCFLVLVCYRLLYTPALIFNAWFFFFKFFLLSFLRNVVFLWNSVLFYRLFSILLLTLFDMSQFGSMNKYLFK